MYNSYNSLRDIIQKDIDNQKSVLNKFPEHIARPITQSCSKYLTQFTSHQLPLKSDKPSSSSADSHSKSTNNASSNQSANLNNITSTTNNNSELINDTALTNLTNLAALTDVNASISTINIANTTTTNIDLFSENSTNENTNNTNNQSSSNESSEKVNIIQLDSIEQVNWTLENLMYGLTLGLEYQEIIKDCWSVYHDWLSVLLDEPKQFLPHAIRDDPINYSRKMLWHLYHLFTPRNKEQQTTSNNNNNKTSELTKHVMMCHNVLLLIETIAKDSKLLQQDLWEDLLKWLLAINDSVLAQPFNKDDFGEILSSRIVATLFEIWLIACIKHFPSPSLWRTFQEFCTSWRHHLPLVIEWNRVCYALTLRLLELTWWPDMSPKSQLPNTSETNAAYDIWSLINSMNTDQVMQAWFRFFHIIGRPLEFCDQLHIQKVLDQARQQKLNKDFDFSVQSAYPCMKKLPIIFLEFLKGVNRIVDLFLGITTPSSVHSSSSGVLASHAYSSPSAQKTPQQTPTTTNEQKARSKSVMVHTTHSTAQATLTSQQLQQSSVNTPLIANLTQLHQTDTGSRIHYLYKSNRPSVNSLLHLVGQWLFEAAIKYIPDKNSTSVSESSQPEAYSKLHNQFSREFVLGQAEAYGILCKIFCSAKTNEKILPEYLSRFYSALLLGLKVPGNFGDLNSLTNEYESGEILGSIIVNGHNMFKLDLDGVNILHMPVLNALNAVFKLKYPIKEDTSSSKDQQKPKELVKSIFHIGFSSISLVELKRYCVYIFSSLLCLANHLNNLPIYDRELNLISNQNFFSLRSKILEIFLAAMSNEQDTTNLQMLFGCGRLIVGEWSLDEMCKTSPIFTETCYADNKKERLPFCFNQVVSLICAPLKIQNSTLQNHSFALAIFDSLSSITTGDIIIEDESVFKLAISWIWHYVKTQIKRRSREHTKEMHSVIVAAYNCLIMLLVKKPNLLRDKQCLQTVTNCIEIGISGSSSYPSDQKIRDENKEVSTGSSNSSSVSSASSSSGATLMKSEKELKPASLRVKEAAESVLCFIMEHTTSFTPPHSDTVIDSIRMQLNEKVLSDLVDENLGKFKYFAVDGALIIAVLDKSLLNTQASPYPTVTVLLRGPFTCQAWSLHLRNSPFSQSSDTANIKINTSELRQANLPRSVAHKMDHMAGSKLDESELVRHAVPKCELSIPSLNDVASKCVKSLSKFHRFKEEQIEFESKAVENSLDNSRTYAQHIENCLSLKTCQKFQSARMYLSHLGFSALESTTRVNNKDDLPEIIGIDLTDSAFLDQLSILDSLPTRTFASCSIFYVRKNQTNAKAIVENIQANSTDLDENFYSFLHSIGTIIDVNNNNNNNNTSSSSTNDTGCIKKINKLNGVDNVFYWSDISSELVFYLPNGKLNETDLNLDESFKVKSQSVPSDIKVMIVWLEQMQDFDSVPIDELVQEVNSYEALFHPTQITTSYQKQPKEIIILFIHPLKSKLNRIITYSNITKKYFYTMPLVDGMVVSSRMLSSMVRQTVLNIFRRKRLEIDDYQPPHVRRKNKISEIIKKFQSKKSEADFYTSLLME